MGQIIVFDNPLDQTEHRQFDHTGPLIDFLLHEFPNGFHGEHITAINGDKLPVCDYDRAVGPDDLVTIIQLPASPILQAAIPALGVFLTSGTVAAAVTAALIDAAFALALSFAISMFTRSSTSSPSYSSGGSLGAADSVYTFSGSANTARIGQTIPVAYGRNLIAPDLAMQPYAYFENNQQYLVLLNCLGQGEFQIHDIYMAGTSIETLGADVVSVEVYPPGRHKSSFGVITNETGRFENVYTSPSVTDQELTATEMLVTAANIGTWSWEGMTRPWFDLGVLDTVYAEALRNGSRVWIYVDSGPLQGNYEVAHIYHSDDTVEGVKEAGTWYRYRRGWVKGGWANDQDESFGVTVRVGLSPFDGEGTNYPAGAIIGPFRATPKETVSRYLQYDIMFASGAYMVNEETGTAGPVYVEIHFIAEPIDDEGEVVGPPVIHVFSETFATTTPQRRTIHHILPVEGAWQVKAVRFTPVSPRIIDKSACNWTGLKAVLGNTGEAESYGNVTLISAKIKATEGLASNAHSAMTVDCTRMQHGVELRNPALAFIDVLRNPYYGANRPEREIDWDTVNPLLDTWNSRAFDAVFDGQTTVWDALKLALQMQSAMPAAVGSMISIVEDKAHAVPSIVLDAGQIRSLTLSYSFVSSDDYDGIEGKYKAGDNADEYVYWPPDCTNPEEMTLWGCKDYDQALAFVKLAWRKRLYRRQLFSLELEGDGHALSVGQPIGIKHPLLGEEVATMAVVSSVTPNSEFETSVEGFIYRPEVFP